MEKRPDSAGYIEKYVCRDDLYYFGTGKAQEAYRLFGCHPLPEAGLTRFVVWAPHAQQVSVVGDFNGWDESADPMTRLEGGYWVAFTPLLENGTLYKFRIQTPAGTWIDKADPFAFHAETGPGTCSKVWDISGYVWGDAEFLARRQTANPQREAITIYEVHIGSWRIPEGAVYPWYRQVADELAAYCVEMGYTHVELLPVTEYPFDGSWGYQVSGYYAPTSRYGTPQDFMYFVDTLHRAGIGVLMDYVPAHFPRDAHALAAFDGAALFEPSDPIRAAHPEWGTLIFDYENPGVQSFLISAAVFFFEQYHIDGIRVDAVSSMLYLDYGRPAHQKIVNREGGNINLDAVAFLQKLNRTILTRYPGAMTIAEESTAYPLVTYPPDVGGLGFTFKWDMGFMHDMIDYMSMDHLFRRDNHNRLTFSMMYAFSEHFILAFSHDEVVHGKCSMVNKMFGDYWQKFAALRALYGYQFAHPGKKLTFMGSEFAQFIEWNYTQSLDWELLTYPMHDGFRSYMQALNGLYTRERPLYDIEDSWDGFTWLNVDDAPRSAVAFLRRDTLGNMVIVACNFTPNPVPQFPIGLPGEGTLQLLLNSDGAQYGGSGAPCKKTAKSRTRPFGSFPRSAQLSLPPLSTVYYRFKPRKEPEHDAKNHESKPKKGAKRKGAKG